jgi:hypothetical protein
MYDDHGNAHDETDAEEPYDDEWSEDDAVEDDWPRPFGDASRGALVAACLVGVATTLVLVLIWSALTRGDDDSGSTAEPGPRPVASTSDPAPSTLPRVRATATRLSRCVSAEQSLQEPLEAARPALDQWAVHVGAMNKLVLGEITLQQATDFWESTRLGAHRRVGDFHDAVATLRRHGVDCPSPELLAPGARALPSCAREVRADARALRAAQVSIGTWDEHIHHMDMLRLGEMTPAEATRMWLASWQRGQHELDAYEAAARVAEDEDGCSSAGLSR